VCRLHRDQPGTAGRARRSAASRSQLAISSPCRGRGARYTTAQDARSGGDPGPTTGGIQGNVRLTIGIDRALGFLRRYTVTHAAAYDGGQLGAVLPGPALNSSQNPALAPAPA
jgi:hypothetical protein